MSEKNIVNAGKRSRFDSIDGLKYILMLFIISCHYLNSFAWSTDNVPGFHASAVFFGNSHLAVELFFMISGFLTVYSIGRKKFTFQAYMADRIKRLYPLMIIWTLIAVAVAYYDTWVVQELKINHSLWKLTYSITGIGRWLSTSYKLYDGPTWYVEVLVLCDAVFCLVYRLIEKTGSKSTIAVYLSVVVIALGLKMKEFDAPFINESVMRGVMNYFIGCVICAAAEKPIKHKLVAILYFGVALAILLGSFITESTAFIGNVQLCVSFIIGPGVILGVLYIPVVKKLFSWKPLCYLGKTTYSMLCSHLVLLNVMRLLDLSKDSRRYRVYLLYLAVSTVIGIISYELIEKRLIKRLLPKLGQIFVEKEKTKEISGDH